jgi:hypothetical protein
MRRIAISGLFLLFNIFFVSCEEDEISLASDYLIFGHFYGFCIGESCIQIYKLERDKLLEDSNKTYPRYDEFYEGSYMELDKTIFNQVEDIREHFPVEMLNEQDTVYGCPDCADGGGLYVEFKSDSLHRFWLIDQDKSRVPEYLYDFMDIINAKIDLVNTLKTE